MKFRVKAVGFNACLVKRIVHERGGFDDGRNSDDYYGTSDAFTVDRIAAVSDTRSGRYAGICDLNRGGKMRKLTRGKRIYGNEQIRLYGVYGLPYNFQSLYSGLTGNAGSNCRDRNVSEHRVKLRVGIFYMACNYYFPEGFVTYGVRGDISVSKSGYQIGKRMPFGVQLAYHRTDYSGDQLGTGGNALVGLMPEPSDIDGDILAAFLSDRRCGFGGSDVKFAYVKATLFVFGKIYSFVIRFAVVLTFGRAALAGKVGPAVF